MKIKQRAKRRLGNTPRFESLILLDQIIHHHQYSNVVIDEWLNKQSMSERDQNLVVRLVYGVIQHQRTLEYYLSPLIKGRKVDEWVYLLLLLSLEQFVYLDRIPDHAVIHEAVEIAKQNGHGGIGKFVNGVLRQFQRQPLRSFADLPLVERLSIQYSVDEWIVELLLEDLSPQEVERQLESINQIPYLSARIHPARPEDRLSLQQQLKTEKIQSDVSQLSPVGLRILSGDFFQSQTWQDNRFIIQDESSQLVAPLGQLTGDEIVLDACSAPGGKATHIAELLPEGHLTALDISERKLQLVGQHLERLDLIDRVELKVCDATKFNPASGQKYDRIYIDAPCSGLGLMRRKPEIKYTKSFADVEALAEIQLQLLHHLSQYLRPGGFIIYSTCTITKTENEAVIDSFLQERPDFVIEPITATELAPQSPLTHDGFVRLYPADFGSDGFFIARLKKTNDH